MRENVNGVEKVEENSVKFKSIFVKIVEIEKIIEKKIKFEKSEINR